MKVNMDVMKDREKRFTRMKMKWDEMTEQEREKFLAEHPGLAKRLRVSQVDLSGWNKKTEKENEK